MSQQGGSAQLLHVKLDEKLERSPETPFCRFLDDRAYSTREIHDASLRVTVALQHAGVTKGTRVATAIDNRVEFLQILFGVSRAGAILVPLNTSMRGATLAHQLETTRPMVLFIEDALRAQMADVVDRSNFIERVIVVGGPTDGPDQYEQFVDVAGDCTPMSLEHSDPAIIFFTSGTTGASKGVTCSHNFVIQLAGESIGWMLGYTRDDVIYTCLPLFHANALLNGFVPCLIFDCTVTIARRFSVANYWSDIVDSGATVTNMLGSMVQLLMKQPAGENESKHRLRLVMTVPTPAKPAEFESRFGVPITEGCGSTEAGMILSIPSTEHRPGSCGIPAPGWECQLVDEFDRPVERGARGELVARPTRPFIMMSDYWGMPEATVAAWRNLWFHTGDYLTQDAEGWYYYSGRMNDVIRHRGENVSPFEVEQALLRHSAVREAAAFPVPSELGEDDVMASVVLEPGHGATAQELGDFCAANLPYFAVPRYIDLRSELPKTQTGKVQKSSLREAGVGAGTYDRGPTRRVART